MNGMNRANTGSFSSHNTRNNMMTYLVQSNSTFVLWKIPHTKALFNFRVILTWFSFFLTGGPKGLSLFKGALSHRPYTPSEGHFVPKSDMIFFNNDDNHGQHFLRSYFASVSLLNVLCINLFEPHTFF